MQAYLIRPKECLNVEKHVCEKNTKSRVVGRYSKPLCRQLHADISLSDNNEQTTDNMDLPDAHSPRQKEIQRPPISYEISEIKGISASVAQTKKASMRPQILTTTASQRPSRATSCKITSGMAKGAYPQKPALSFDLPRSTSMKMSPVERTDTLADERTFHRSMRNIDLTVGSLRSFENVATLILEKHVPRKPSPLLQKVTSSPSIRSNPDLCINYAASLHEEHEEPTYDTAICSQFKNKELCSKRQISLQGNAKDFNERWKHLNKSFSTGRKAHVWKELDSVNLSSSTPYLPRRTPGNQALEQSSEIFQEKCISQSKNAENVNGQKFARRDVPQPTSSKIEKDFS